ncbi:hypothetical protein EV714DRAFT_253907 [Schizophyllum commune]
MTAVLRPILVTAISQMTPAAPGPVTKRKAAEDPNTLMQSTKKAKKDPQGSKSGKRKLFNGEEQPGGFIIARGPSAQPPSRPPSVQPSVTTNGTGEPPPPAKRKKTASVPPTTPSRLDVPNPRSRDPDGQGPCIPTRSSPELDEDAQAMTTEADELRRSSRSFSTTTTPAATQKHQRRRSGVIPVHDAESPTIERNRALRGEDARGRGDARTPTTGRRRSSLNSRGKRVSDIYASTGVIPTPHESVSGASFHKHIDHEQPEPERLRQVLIWHADRGASDTETSSTLTPTARQLYAHAQEAFIGMLHDKKIHLPTYHTDSSMDSATMKPNKFNVTNTQWEATYTQRNAEAEARYEEWNQCRYTYDEYIKKERAKLEKEKQGDLSTKARGKQRADEPELPESYFPQEHLIPDETTRRHVAIAREATTSGPTLAQKRRQRFDQFKFDADQLRDFAHSARTLVRLASDALDARFAQLRGRLIASGGAPYVAGGGSAEVLNAYARPTAAAPDAQTLLRALFRVDAQRPQARQGQAAMSAARELRELDERGAGGERRLTAGVVPPTPKRQVPGTPRRGTTPGRSNTPKRSGTPGR